VKPAVSFVPDRDAPISPFVRRFQRRIARVGGSQGRACGYPALLNLSLSATLRNFQTASKLCFMHIHNTFGVRCE